MEDEKKTGRNIKVEENLVNVENHVGLELNEIKPGDNVVVIQNIKDAKNVIGLKIGQIG